MENFVDAIGTGFERILRWLYPGALFLVLLFLSNPSVFKIILTPLLAHNKNYESFAVWQLIIAGAVAGMAIYLIHYYIFNWIISLLITRSGLLDRETRDLQGLPERLAQFAERWNEPTWRRWGIRQNRPTRHTLERANNWLNYSWSTYHAGCITLYLAVLFSIFKESSSVLGNWFIGKGPWFYLGLVIFLVLFLKSLLWQYIILTRLTFVFVKHSHFSV